MGSRQDGRQGGQQQAGSEQAWGRADPELTKLAREVMAQVAKLRGLAFDGEVAARYADKATFLRYMQAMESELIPAQRKISDQWVARMLGWAPLDMDLDRVQAEILASQVGGFYDPKRKTFFVMEGFGPDLVRILMAHELTHALDDQHFDLLGVDRGLMHNTDAYLAHHAVVEGSAQTVMGRWLREHAASLDQKALREFQAQMDLGLLSTAPRYMWQPLFAIYSCGQSFLARKEGPAALALGTSEDLQQAFEQLPVSTEQILHPAKYWNPESADLPLDVRHDVSGIPEKWSAVHSDVLGELFAAVCLQSQTKKLGLLSIMGLKFTNRGAQGWGGDRLTLLRNGDQGAADTARVLVLDWYWDSDQDADEFLEALQEKKAPESPLSRKLARLAGSRVRLVAWLGVSRGTALEVAAGVQSSQQPWGKIPSGQIPSNED